MPAISEAAEKAQNSPGDRPSGCVLLEDEEIVTAAANEPAGSTDDGGVLHAEVAAVASVVRQGIGPINTAVVMHVNPDSPGMFQQSMPCRLCRSILKASGVNRLVFVNYGRLVTQKL